MCYLPLSTYLNNDQTEDFEFKAINLWFLSSENYCNSFNNNLFSYWYL